MKGAMTIGPILPPGGVIGTCSYRRGNSCFALNENWSRLASELKCSTIPAEVPKRLFGGVHMALAVLELIAVLFGLSVRFVRKPVIRARTPLQRPVHRGQ